MNHVQLFLCDISLLLSLLLGRAILARCSHQNALRESEKKKKKKPSSAIKRAGKQRAVDK